MTLKKIRKMADFGILTGILCLLAFSVASAGNVPRMTPDTLNGLLGSPGVMILDVRSASDWNPAVSKIQGAERSNPKEIKNWADAYPQGVTLVLY